MIRHEQLLNKPKRKQTQRPASSSSESCLETPHLSIITRACSFNFFFFFFLTFLHVLSNLHLYLPSGPSSSRSPAIPIWAFSHLRVRTFSLPRKKRSIPEHRRRFFSCLLSYHIVLCNFVLCCQIKKYSVFWHCVLLTGKKKIKQLGFRRAKKVKTERTLTF